MIEIRQAMRDVRDSVREWGEPLGFFIRSEEDVKRGSLGSQVARSVRNVRVHCYPIERTTDAKTLSKAGLTRECSTVLYTSALEWRDLGISNFDVSRMTVALDGKEWQVSEVAKVGRIKGDFLYVTFGLK